MISEAPRRPLDQKATASHPLLCRYNDEERG